MGRSLPSSIKRRSSGTLARSFSRSAGPPGGQQQLAFQGRVDQRGEHAHPVADLTLAQAKEHRHHFLQGVALEVEQHEKELRAAARQRALETAAQLALARLPGVGSPAALGLPGRVKDHQQPLELARVERGQRA